MKAELGGQKSKAYESVSYKENKFEDYKDCLEVAQI